MTKTKGVGSGRGHNGGGGMGAPVSAAHSAPPPTSTSGLRMPSPRKPLATKRTQRPSPAYNSPSADYPPHPLAVSSSAKKMDMRPSPVWLHGDTTGGDAANEGKHGPEFAAMMDESARAFAAQFSSENSSNSTNVPPLPAAGASLKHNDAQSMATKLPPSVPSCLNSDPVVYVGENQAHPSEGPRMASQPMISTEPGAAPAAAAGPLPSSHMGIVSELLGGKADGLLLPHHHHHLHHMHQPHLAMHPGLGCPPPLLPGTPLMGPPPPVDKKKRSSAKKATPKMAGGGGRWTKEEDQKLRDAVAQVGPQNWKMIANDWLGEQRSDVQCLHRWQKVLQPGLVKGPWTKEEDQVIVDCIDRGITKWSEIAERIPGRIGKQCRERWFNHLDPNLKKGGWTDDEDATLVDAQARWGNAWTKIAKLLPGRSENAVKNRWNSATRRRAKAASRAAAEGKPFRSDSKSGLNLNALLHRGGASGHDYDDDEEDDEDDEGDSVDLSNAGDRLLGLGPARDEGGLAGAAGDGKNAEIFGSDSNSMLIAKAMEYAGMGEQTPPAKDHGSSSRQQSPQPLIMLEPTSPSEGAIMMGPRSTATTGGGSGGGKKKGGGGGAYGSGAKKGGKKQTGAEHTAGVSALVAAAEAQAAAAGLVAAAAAVAANGSPRNGQVGGRQQQTGSSSSSSQQGPGPAFEAPHEEFEHHDHGVQWDFNPEQSGGLGQSIEFLKGVDNPVDCPYSADLPTMDDGIKGVDEEFTLSTSLMNISLDKEIVDEIGHEMGRHVALHEMEGKSAEFIAQYIANAQQQAASSSSSTFRARKPVDLSIDCRVTGGQGAQGSGSRGGNRGRNTFSPYGGPSSRGSPSSLRHQHLFTNAGSLATPGGGGGIMMMMGGQLSPTMGGPHSLSGTSAAVAAAALGAAAAAALSSSSSPSPCIGGISSVARPEDFFLDSPTTALGGRGLSSGLPGSPSNTSSLFTKFPTAQSSTTATTTTTTSSSR